MLAAMSGSVIVRSATAPTCQPCATAGYAMFSPNTVCRSYVAPPGTTLMPIASVIENALLCGYPAGPLVAM